MCVRVELVDINVKNFDNVTNNSTILYKINTIFTSLPGIFSFHSYFRQFLVS